MSNETNGGGSDLDIFEGLGKKASERLPAAPPPPPGSSSHVQVAQVARSTNIDAKRTLLGIPGPAMPSAVPVPASQPPVPPAPVTRPSTSEQSAAPASSPSLPVPPARTASKPPPPPPGRGSLPNITSNRSQPPQPPVDAGPPPSAQPNGAPLRPSVPPPASTRPGAGRTSSNPAPVTQPLGAQPVVQAKNGAKLDMDWDDDNEATQVFDKEKTTVDPDASAQALIAPDAPEPERASMDAIMSAPPARVSSLIPAAAPAAGNAPASANSATLSGAFGALGQPRSNGSMPPSAKFPHGAPTARSAPPPPPGQSVPQSLPPPPPPGQVTTAPMHMPLQAMPPHTETMQSAQSPMGSHAHGSVPPHAHGSVPPQAYGSVPPHPSVMPSAPPIPHLPPVSRAMEATHMVARAPANKGPLVIGLLVAVVGIAAAVVFFLMPRTGTLVVNVADSKGGAVSNLEILVDGTKRCESAPCIVHDIAAGVHEVKVVAKGFDPPAPRAVTVDSRRDVPTDFHLTAAKTAAGTGFKVAATHSGVKLVVDGKDIGPLPQEMRDLEPGEHKLRFVGERYAPLEKTISVAKDEIVDLGNVNLKVVKGKATIQLGTPGAKVYLVNGTNRKEVPQFPMAIEFDPNEKWELQGTKDGFDEYHERISFDDGQAEKTFTVSLSPKGSAAAPQRAAPPVAFAPPVAKEPAPPAAKAAAKEPAAAPDAPKEAKKEAPAAAAGGDTALKINSLPASSIVLDGKPIGVTPQLHVPVAPGTHTIMFVNSEQSLKKTISVDVKAGETKAAFAKLRD